jgi:8-oxo-dGTP pyrophosphatase MutT (NUDIX family)
MYCKVFPGGNTDAGDGSPEVTAIRETFEESGVLLASSSSPSKDTARWPRDDEKETARKEVHAQRLAFGAFLDKHGLTPDEHALLPFSQWITPATAPKYIPRLSNSPPSNIWI